MTVLVIARFDPDQEAAWREALAAALPAERLVFERGRVRDDDIDVAMVADPPQGALTGLSHLRLIQSLWAGVEGLLADPTVPADVPLARMVDPAMNTAMAETALWAVLSLHRDHVDYARDQCDRRWQPRPQRRADEVAVLVLGLGQMGGACADRLVANGYAVSGWSARPAQRPGVRCAHGDAALHTLLGEADIVVNLLPLTPATRGLFDAAAFAHMRPSAAWVNLARGGHVVEADLLAALDAGRLRHAVLDVFAREPLPTDHPFWRHPRVTLRPHVAAQTDPRSAAVIAARNVHALREGRPLADRVDRARGY